MLDRLGLHNKIYTAYLSRHKPDNLSAYDFFKLLGRENLCSMEEIKRIWEDYVYKIKKGTTEDRISLYVNLPYCLIKCEYCRHYFKKAEDKSELDVYLEKIVRKARFFKGIFSGIRFKTINIGGGTPSILNEAQLEKLLSALQDNFNFEKEGQSSFECNPFTTSSGKLNILSKYGINRISFGVQSVNPKILKSMNRGYQDLNQVRIAVNSAKKYKFRINIDLMIGLKGDTAKTVIESFRKVAVLLPYTITLYSLQPTKEYLIKYYEGNERLFCEDLAPKLNGFFRLIDREAFKCGYMYFSRKSLGCDADGITFIRKDFQPYKYSYDDTKPMDCFGLGTGSVSYIFGNLNYQENSGEDICGDEFDKKIYKVIKFNDLRDAKLYYILDSFLLKRHIFIPAYKRLFSSSILKEFKQPLNELKKFKKVRIRDDSIFFMPRSFKQKFIYCSLFIHRVFRKPLPEDGYLTK